MRIVQLNPFYFPYAGGIERRLRSIARRLGRRHDVHIVTAQLPGTPAGATAEDGYTVHRLRSSFPLRRFYNPPPVRTRGLADAVADLRPDILDYHFRWAPAYNRAFRNADGTRRFVTYHNLYGEGVGLLTPLSRLNDRLYMRTLRAADRVLCVSGYLRDDLERRGIPPGRLGVSHNAVERDDIEQVQGRPAGAPEGPYVVAVGRLVAVKGFDVLIDAWPDVPRDLHLVLVGQGPQAGRLRRRAGRAGVADRVHVTGWLDEVEKIRLLKHCVAYAHPARFEAFALSALEAMTAGAPVVAARVGGLAEVVGDAGLLLGHAPRAWAAALTRLAEDSGERKRRSSASRARARAFDWDEIARDLEHAYTASARG